MQGKLVKSGFAVSVLLVFNLFGTAVPETNSLSPLNQIQARLEISKNVFPASDDCELSLQFAKNCPDPLYTTFILTYTP